MGTFSYEKKKKLSFGNRIGYIFALTDVQTTGSTLYTPFKKITGYMIETASSTTAAGATTINVASNTESAGPSTQAYLTFASGAADADGTITVVGLL